MIALHKAASHKERVGLSRPWTPLTSAGDNHLSLSFSLSFLASFNSSSLANRQTTIKFTTAG